MAFTFLIVSDASTSRVKVFLVIVVTKICIVAASITHFLAVFSHSSHASGGTSDRRVKPSLHNPIQSSGIPFSLQHVLLKVRWPLTYSKSLPPLTPLNPRTNPEPCPLSFS